MDRQTADTVYTILEGLYPAARTHHRDESTPFQSLIATILSAQTTDKAVDEVIGPLMERYPDAASLAAADPADVEPIIRRTGFFHMKARRIIDAAKVIMKDFGGAVPDSMDSLLTIPGVGRKTANIVLYHSFGRQEGIAVDTHVLRLSGLIGFSDSRDPGIVEKDLTALFPKKSWGVLTDLLILHGRTICIARRPKCPACGIRQYCRFFKEQYREDDRGNNKSKM